MIDTVWLVLYSPEKRCNIAALVHDVKSNKFLYTTNDQELREAFDIVAESNFPILQKQKLKNVQVFYESVVDKKHRSYLLHFVQPFLNPLVVGSRGTTQRSAEDMLEYLNYYIK